MKTKNIVYGLIVIAILILVIVGVNNSRKPGKYDDFAKCLTYSNVKFYGSFQCPHCAEQKRIFGKSIKYINYIECGPLSGPQTQICKDNHLRYYPTWEFNNTKTEDVLEVDELSSMTGCKL